MQHKCRVTVLDKKCFPELQQSYCADREAGPCPCYRVGDTYLFERFGGADHFWRMGLGTLEGEDAPGVAGSASLPHCSEAWDAISRYIYTALQGGDIMRGWMADRRVMIACCNDGTRPVVFEIRRLDYKAVTIEGIGCDGCRKKLSAALRALPGVTDVRFRPSFAELYVDGDVPDEAIRRAVAEAGAYRVSSIA